MQSVHEITTFSVRDELTLVNNVGFGAIKHGQ
jgi:hypothetical protein